MNDFDAKQARENALKYNEMKYEETLEIVESFKKELKNLFLKYDFNIIEADNYDRNDDYVSTYYYFSVNGDKYYNETINEIIEDALNN